MNKVFFYTHLTLITLICFYVHVEIAFSFEVGKVASVKYLK